MPHNTCVPLYRPGGDLTGFTTAAVVGKTFADISADIQSGPDITQTALDAVYDGGNIQVATCAPGARPIGVFAYDQVQGAVVPLLLGPGFVVPVTAGAAITAGDEVQVGTSGQAIPTTSTAAVAAALLTGVVGSNNALTWTAKDAGADGNEITVALVNPGTASHAIAVAVVDNAITVTLATDSGSALTSTAAQITTAVSGNAPANALVGTANTSSSSGAGVAAAVAPTHLAGGSDGGAGKSAGKAFTTAASGADCFVRLY